MFNCSSFVEDEIPGVEAEPNKSQETVDDIDSNTKTKIDNPRSVKSIY